jgi:hypothetical protein
VNYGIHGLAQRYFFFLFFTLVFCVWELQLSSEIAEPFKAGIKSLRATMPDEIFYFFILIFKGLTARRFYKSFGVKGLILFMMF